MFEQKTTLMRIQGIKKLSLNNRDNIQLHINLSI